jgi:hypothetical protein
VTFLIKHYSRQQEASYSLRPVPLGLATFRLALAKPPSMSRGKDGEGLGPPRSCDPDVGFSQAPEHVEGGGGYGVREEEEEVVLDPWQRTA